MHAAHGAAVQCQCAVDLADGTRLEQRCQSGGAKYALKISSPVLNRFPLDDRKPLQRCLGDNETVAQSEEEV